ncbi:MAG: serine/threonine protein kinase [bacterium]|nr:MAG: serine/threonine protein kinase [bacterium]
MSRKLGKYQILAEIGRGGMAVVYRARQESLDRVVAIKELDIRRTTADIRAAERFRLEARAAASLDHPNIITIHDFWEMTNKAFIAMEFVDGLELKEVLDRFGAVDPMLAAQIVIKVCDALSYAHERGIIHRDVKPGNIMLSAKGDVKLADFGIVFVSGSADLTTTGQIIGTPSYMSPEQIRGEELTPASDIFSLGIVLYEAATGSKPFTAPSDVALTHAILRRRPIRPRRLNPAVNRSLSRTIMKSLRKKPHRRFATMEEMAAALRRTLPRRALAVQEGVARLIRDGRASESPDATIPVTTDIQPRRYVRFSILAGVTLAACVILLLAWPRETPREPAGIPAAPQSLQVPLTIVAYPWAEIILDGRSLGYTPAALPFPVSPGRHTLTLENPHLGSRTFTLDLSPGTPHRIAVDFLEKGR